MKISKIKIAITVSFIVLLGIFTPNAQGVMLAHDKVSLFENGIKISDNSVIWQEKGSINATLNVCLKGICDIGQHYYPITFYKTNVSNISDYDNLWLNAHPDQYRDEYQAELLVLAKKAMYSIDFDAGTTSGGWGSKNNMDGGMIGTPRELNFDLRSNYFILYFITASVVIILIILLFVIKHLKSKKVATKKVRRP